MRLTDHELRQVLSRGGRGGEKPRKGIRSRLEGDLVLQLERTDGVPDFVINYRWHSTRQWLWDIAWPDLMIAVEIDGTRRDGKGAHQTEKGITEDCEKLANGILWGWVVLRFTGTMVKNGDACDLILRIITRRAAPSV